jgi:hypothetical protein
MVQIRDWHAQLGPAEAAELFVGTWEAVSENACPILGPSRKRHWRLRSGARGFY